MTDQQDESNPDESTPDESTQDEWELDGLDLDAYLARIGYGGPREASAEVLRQLHRRHAARIRFENLDVLLGRGVGTALGDVQRKLVTARRGGYCYEHGVLLGAVLQRLGFGVVRRLARVGPDGPVTRTRSHLVLDVTAPGGGRYLADTGFGSGLLEPLPWAPEEPVRQGGWSFRLHRRPGGEDPWRLQTIEDGAWVTMYRFEEVPQHAVDIASANWFTSTHPGSPFRAKLVVANKDDERLWMLRGRTLSVQPAGGTPAETVLDDDQVAAALAEQFGDALGEPEIRALVAGLPVPVG
jgi:N-hydroxyarylamine O-acetyltransferase